MADRRLSELAGTTPASNDKLYVSKTSGGPLDKSVTVADLQTYILGNLVINDQVGTTYTPVISDLSKLVRMNNAAANTFTVPPYVDVAFEIGSVIMVEQVGVGATTIVPGAAVTINSPPATSLTLAGQRSMVTLIKVGANEWDISGAVTSLEPLVQTVNISSGDVAIDYSAGRVVTTPLDANITTFTLTNIPPTGSHISLLWKGVADGTGRTVAFVVNGVTAKWDGGGPPSIPATAGHQIWVRITSDDATATVYCLVVAADIS